MILHLIDDPKFLKGAIELFEKYYPKQNHFFIQIARNNTTHTNNVAQNIYYVSFTKKDDINFIINYTAQNNVQHLLVHNLTYTKAALANVLKSKTHVRTYWIFYGADLYGVLNELGKYPLIDNQNEKPKSSITLKTKMAFAYLYQQLPFDAYKKCIAQLDYFCFWNNYDYELLKKHFTTSATYKQFLYYNLIDRNYTNISFAKQHDKVLINHSASANGNHTTILQKLRQILPQDNAVNIITPLSYGSERIKNEVINIGTNLFGNRFTPIVDYMQIDQYYSLLNNLPVAIFGSRRQEGGGNIFYMLGKGAKVFLRNDNNMIEWLKGHGFLIFSFENDLLSADDLLPLSVAQMEANITIHKKLFSESSEFNNISSLITFAQ